MLDVFQLFEQSGLAYDTRVLVMSGLVAVLLGIFLWLGGSLFARLSVGIIWLLLAAGVGIFFLNPLAAIGFGLIGSIIVMVFKRFSTGMLTSVLMAFMAFLVVCQYAGSFETAKDDGSGKSYQQSGPPIKKGSSLDAGETFAHLKLMISDVCKSCIQVGRDLDVKYQGIVGITGFFTLLIGCTLPRLADAASFATAGTLLIWGGMVLMLLSKGATPLTGLFTRAGMYVAMMSAMIGVGALEQLLFCSKRGEKNRDKRASSGSKGK